MDRSEVMATLREKVPYEAVADADDLQEVAATDGSTRPAPPEVQGGPGAPSSAGETTDPGSGGDGANGADGADGAATSPDGDGGTRGTDSAATPAGSEDGAGTPDADDGPEPTDRPETVRGHVRAVVGDGSGLVRLLDAEATTLDEGPVEETFDRVEAAETVPVVIVVDGALTQRVLDVCAQRGVEQVIARSTGEFVKQPTSVRVRTADQLLRPQS
jgi:hypothetical protein